MEIEKRVEALEGEVAEIKESVEEFGDYLLGPKRPEIAGGGRDVASSPFLKEIKAINGGDSSVPSESVTEDKSGFHIKLGSWEVTLSPFIATLVAVGAFVILAIAPEVAVLLIRPDGP